jgi:hypothetical protein
MLAWRFDNLLLGKLDVGCWMLVALLLASILLLTEMLLARYLIDWTIGCSFASILASILLRDLMLLASMMPIAWMLARFDPVVAWIIGCSVASTLAPMSFLASMLLARTMLAGVDTSWSLRGYSGAWTLRYTSD